MTSNWRGGIATEFKRNGHFKFEFIANVFQNLTVFFCQVTALSNLNWEQSCGQSRQIHTLWHAFWNLLSNYFKPQLIYSNWPANRSLFLALTHVFSSYSRMHIEMVFQRFYAFYSSCLFLHRIPSHAFFLVYHEQMLFLVEKLRHVCR